MLRLVAAVPCEADDPELCRCDDLPAGTRAEHRLGVLGQGDPVGDRVAERGEPEHLDRQPQLQRADAARELDAAVAEVDLAAEGVAQVLAVQREGPLEQARLADQDGAGLVGLEQPLVRVDRQRIGALYPGQRLPARLAQRGGGSVGAVDVEPQSLCRAQVRQPGSGSTAPLLVVPALATTANGVRPAARSAATAARRRRPPGAEATSRTAAPAPRAPPSPSGRAGSTRAPGRKVDDAAGTAARLARRHERGQRRPSSRRSRAAPRSPRASRTTSAASRSP